jgi:hypothetical protein
MRLRPRARGARRAPRGDGRGRLQPRGHRPPTGTFHEERAQVERLRPCARQPPRGYRLVINARVGRLPPHLPRRSGRRRPGRARRQGGAASVQPASRRHTDCVHPVVFGHPGARPSLHTSTGRSTCSPSPAAAVRCARGGRPFRLPDRAEAIDLSWRVSYGFLNRVILHRSRLELCGKRNQPRRRAGAPGCR